MEVFLPIAQVHVTAIEIILLSALVGVLSGLFGVGGGFLMTPFLIFMGVPPAYAVANEANNILATSVSGSTTHWLKNTLDYKMGLMIVIGGTIGTVLGILTFTYFKDIKLPHFFSKVLAPGYLLAPFFMTNIVKYSIFLSFTFSGNVIFIAIFIGTPNS